MKIVLVAATPFEIQPTLDLLQKKGSKVRSNEISFLITGVGAVSTTYSLSKEIHYTKPQLIVQAGIAGTFSEIDLTQTVVIKEDCFADIGVVEDNHFKTVFEMGLSNPDQSPFTKGVLPNPYPHLLGLTNLPLVKGMSVNEISTDKNKIAWYQQNANAVVESMEGAAFHYVCLKEQVPFLQIRSISNRVGERDKPKWKMKESIESLNEKLILLLEKIDALDETYFRI